MIAEQETLTYCLSITMFPHWQPSTSTRSWLLWQNLIHVRFEISFCKWKSLPGWVSLVWQILGSHQVEYHILLQSFSLLQDSFEYFLFLKPENTLLSWHNRWCVTSSCICLERSSSWTLACSKEFFSTWSGGVWANNSWRVMI